MPCDAVCERAQAKLMRPLCVVYTYPSAWLKDQNPRTRTAERHDRYEKTHGEHHWADWYAPYLNARQQGGSPEEAAAAADRYMEESLHVLAR